MTQWKYFLTNLRFICEMLVKMGIQRSSIRFAHFQIDEIVLAAGLIAWLSIDYVLLGPYSAIYAGDSMTLMPGVIAGKFLESPAAGWNNLSAAGWDRIANTPLGAGNYWLFFLLPPWLAYQINILIQIVAGFGGIYALTRYRLGLDARAALFAAFLFATSINGQIHMFSWNITPFWILACSLVVESCRQPWRWALVLGVSTLMANLAWIAELVPFAAVSMVTWFLFVERPRRVGQWAIVLLVSVLPIALRLNDLAILVQYSDLSHRELVVPVPQWSDILVSPFSHFNRQDLLAAGIFALGLVAVSPEISKEARRILVGVLLWIAAIYAFITLQMFLVEWLPQLRGYDFWRFIHAPELLLVIGAAFALQAVITRQGSIWPTGRSLRVLFALLMAGVAWSSLETKYVNLYSWITQGNSQANFESPALTRLAARIRANGGMERAEMVQMYSSYLNTYGVETAGGGPNALFSRRYYEFWSTLVEPWLTTRKTAPGTFGTGVPELYKRTSDWPLFRGPILMLSPDDHREEFRLGVLYRLNMLSLANVGWLVSRDRLNDPELELVEDGGRPWNSVTTFEKIKRSVIANFLGRDHLFIYRNTKVLPRFFSVDTVSPQADGRAVLKAVAAMPVEELRHRVVAEAATLPRGLDASRRFAPAEFRLLRASSDALELAVEGDGPTLLVVSNSYSPFWSCLADDQPVDIFPAYHAFWGILLPPGTRHVSCTYRSPDLLPAALW